MWESAATVFLGSASGAALPTGRIAASMETGEYLNLMVPQAEKQTIRKAVKSRAMRGAANGGKL
jgi:hypothetical protein